MENENIRQTPLSTPVSNPGQPPIEPLQNSVKRLTIFIVLFIIIVIFGIGTYFLGAKSQPAPTPQPTPLAVVQPTPTPDPTADWKTYTNKKYNYLMKYPQNWSLEEFSETRPQFNDSYQSTVFYSPNKEYALSFGLRKAGETIKLSGRTGVSAGDFVTGTSIVIAGVSIPTKNLVYKDKLKAVFYQSGDFFSIGNFEANADFDRVAIDDYDSRDLTNSLELSTANQILSTFKFTN